MKAKETGLNRASRARTARRRSRIYGTLAAIYERPLEEVFLGLLRRLTIPDGSFLALPNDQLSGGLIQLRRWLDDKSTLPDGALSSQLAPAFPRLFRGVNRRSSPLPPYESVYLEGRLWGDATGKIAEIFRQYSLVPRHNEPPDHISLELDFMRLLCQSESEAGPTGERDLVEVERIFLKEHLLRWSPALCGQIRKFDATGFYKAMADITEGWLTCDLAEIERLVVDKQI